MGTIVRLSDEICSQIAAGEVVERPASVVKELVENAIDAQATRIEVDIGAGGITWIRVTDDGRGMDENDAVLAVERHATSKLEVVDDLLSLNTYGFRGEALPSIASVSKLTLRTRQRSAQAGVEVTTDGSGRVDHVPCGMAPGTIVEVEDLFHNVPARRKFLKSISAESAAITVVVEGLALSQPTIAFQLNRDKKPVRQWLRASSRRQRAISAKPDDRLATIEGERGPLRVESYLSPPERARAGAGGLTLLINNRIVKDRVLARIVAQAYGSVLESGRYPVGVVYLDVDAALVDVNVHPQKAEVRFADPRALQDALFRIITEGLAGAFGLAPASRAYFKPKGSGPTPSFQPSWSQGAAGLPSSPLTSETFSQHSSQKEQDPWGLAPEPQPRRDGIQSCLDLRPEPRNREENIASPLPEPDLQDSRRYGQLRFIAQLRKMFLLCESLSGLVIIDQHAAAERVTFARYRSAYLKGTVSSQKLLVPLSMVLDAEDVAFIEEEAGLIEQTGLEIRVVGPTQGLVTAVPALLGRADPLRLARDLLDERRRAGGRGFSDAIDHALATMACHGSIRAGDSISPEEASSLLAALDEVDFGGHCPHGRPLLMSISYDDLERMVGRR